MSSSALPKRNRNMEGTPTSEYPAITRYSFYWRLRLFSMWCFHPVPGIDQYCFVQVSPYMEFGHVTRILKAHPDADRVLLMSEVASGVFPY